MQDPETTPFVRIPSELFVLEPDWEEVLRATQHDMASATLIIDERRTIKSSRLESDTDMSALMLSTQSISTGQDADFQLLTQIGEGGMGVVHLARQNSLQRQVAIKTLHGDESTRAHRKKKLLQEACVTGRLEHPNIVPVYSLSVDEQDQPLFAMKRIEGVNWFDTLQDETLLPRAHRQHLTLLESHLEIFEQVCMAIHYAHNKGIIHRDLKPDNVMLGDYGEVYVVDWGLAVSLDPREQGPLPHVLDVHHVEGTPMYMAPEQAAAENTLIGPHSDIYALGAILHELITGASRHHGKTLQAMLLCAYQAQSFEYPPEIPAALGAVCNKACARHPNARHVSAEALREHLNDYRKHRRVNEIMAATTQRIAQLSGLYDQIKARKALDPTHPIDSAHMVHAYSLSGACRFGIDQATELSPGDESIARARDEMLHIMLRIELTHKNLAAAQVFKQELADALHPEDAQWFHTLSETLDAERTHIASLKHLEKDLSFRVSRRRKGILGLVLCVVWGLGSFILGPLTGSEHSPQQSFINATIFKVIVLGTMCVVWVVARRFIALTAVNRKWLNMIAVIMVTGLSIRLIAWSMGLGIHDAITLEMFCYGLIAFSLGIMLDRAVMIAGIFYTLGVLGVLLWAPEAHTTAIFATCNLMTMMVMSWRWFSGTGSMVRSREH